MCLAEHPLRIHSLLGLFIQSSNLGKLFGYVARVEQSFALH